MGIFKAFIQSFQEGQKKSHEEAQIRRDKESTYWRHYVKVVEPNSGKTVTIQIIAEEPLRHAYLDSFSHFASNIGAKAIVDGNKVTFKCLTMESADLLRKHFQ